MDAMEDAGAAPWSNNSAPAVNGPSTGQMSAANSLAASINNIGAAIGQAVGPLVMLQAAQNGSRQWPAVQPSMVSTLPRGVPLTSAYSYGGGGAGFNLNPSTLLLVGIGVLALVLLTK